MSAKLIQFTPNNLVNETKARTDDDEKQSTLTIDPEEFHVPASDSKGHQTRIQFRAPKQIRAMVAEVIQSKQFPYRSDSDLLRHAVVRHLKWLTDQGYIGVNTIFAIDAILTVARDDENHQQFIGSLEKLEERVSCHKREGSLEVAENMLADVVEAVDRMPDNSWKRAYKKELKRRFPELIKKD